ncbi:MAG: chitobiase/beta-hexosaminidase C-terminal domain-containing protein [Clostridiales bacterium]|nr:chitobiase/beta-hexosaminidase C-terminal domain-containing protein [Clostridiales bacterium]
MGDISKKLLLFMLLATVFFTACNGEAPDTSGLTLQQKAQTVKVSGDGITGELSFTLEELVALSGGVFEHVYSSINNYPTANFYAAKGIRLDKILEAAGVMQTASLITLRSQDGYQKTLTRQQLLDEPHYYYPGVAQGSAQGAERVWPILAYEYKEKSADLGAAEAGEFCLIIGQRSFQEQTNPLFVKNITEIIVSVSPPEKCAPVTIWPASGQIEAGESISLGHKDSLDRVKIYYTLDGSDPTELSAMYNPSATYYQMDLIKPIVFTESAVLKVLVTQYGKADSDIAVFEIIVK